MAETTAISWASGTLNFAMGCSKVSPGCKNCYAERLMNQFGQDFTKVQRTSDKTFYAALKWQKDILAGKKPRPYRVFVDSMSDFFHEAADPWRDDAWDVIHRTPDITYMILTKRPEMMATRMPGGWKDGPWKNVWLGTSCETQEWAERRIPLLQQIPAHLWFLSVEPMLGPVNLDAHLWLLKPTTLRNPQPTWVICGGESGPHSRPTRLEWVTSLRDQCKAAHIAFHLKQLGGPLCMELGINTLDSKRMQKWPASLQIQEFPDD